MGMVLLILAGVIEVGLAVYSIKTKSNQKRLRNWVRIGSFVVFAVFVTIMKWSLRWEIPAAVLFLFGIIAFISLLRNKEEKKYRPVGNLFKAVGVWALIAVALLPAFIFPQHKAVAVSGSLKIGTKLFTLTDENRVESFTDSGENRKVNIEFWYPQNGSGKYPLIVFSHGAFGIKTSNTSTFENLASNGYVVVSIDHPYHSLYTKDADGHMTLANQSFTKEIQDVNNGVYDEEKSYELGQKWLKLRTDDINFVIDSIKQQAGDQAADKVYQLIDTDKIGLIGHSLGGAAAAKLGRDRNDIAAVINLDADLLGEELGVKDGKPVINKEIYPIPLFSIYTDTMKSLMDSVTDPDVVLPQKYISDTAPDAYEVHIKGTNHLSLTDLPIVSPFLANMINGTSEKGNTEQTADQYKVLRTMNGLVLKFFNSYVKGEGSFEAAETY
ncbi:dienelactone hydrolase family protein [Bacillus sp. FJAT-29814]|uniref:alpha/beta hydrolase family protein n=1 Tax=Bacillus sp. FJAT-29814 TaxID=1729688 RepID=UPI0008299671|nr:dienelactone hydrolase family protein [Bacillus sp. FJAT-29814]